MIREEDILGGPRGLRLRLCHWGPETGRATVVLHGFMEQGAAWESVATRLDRRVVAPDHRGHGLSAHVGPGGFYHFWDYVADVDAIIRHVGGPVDLVGHSMGGTIAVLLTAARPAQVRRLVLVEGLGPPDTRSEALDRATAFLDAMAEPPVHPVFPTRAAAASRVRRFNPSLTEEEALRLVSRILRPVAADGPDGSEGWTWTWDPLHRARSPHPFDGQTFLRYLSAIRCPTLLISGARSMWRPDGVEQRAAALLNARHVDLDAGHLVHHDAPDVLADTIAQFLDQPEEPS